MKKVKLRRGLKLKVKPPGPSSLFQRLRLRNYKAWSEVEVELRPLTLILGANSSGKSSLLQALLLMKQTFESARPDEHLKLKGDLVDAGTFDEIVRRGTAPPRFSIGFDRGLGTYDVTFFPDAQGTPKVERLECRFDEVGLSSTVDLRRGGYRAAGIEKPTRRGTAALKPRRGGPPADPFDPGRSLPPEGTWLEQFFDKDGKIVEAPWPASEEWAGHPDPSDTYLSDLLSDFKRLHYLGPVRVSPERELGYLPDVGEIGRHGERAINRMLFPSKPGDELLENVSTWVAKLGVADAIRPAEVGAKLRDGRVIRKGVDASLLDVGFGVSQVLPVIIQTWAMQPGEAFIVEEPESHLHPAAQSGLADMFVDAVTGSPFRQVIVETHSETLLRRVQRRIAEGKIASGDVAVYFCEQGNDGEARLQALDVDSRGHIRNWPKDFFGDQMADVVALAMAPDDKAE